MTPALVAHFTTSSKLSSSTSSSSSSSSPSSAQSSSTGGWYGPNTDLSILRVTATKPTASSSDLLKYIHNLCTQDVYKVVGVHPEDMTEEPKQEAGNGSQSTADDSNAGVGYSLFLNGRGRVLFDAVWCPTNAHSLRWLQAGVTRGIQQSRGPNISATPKPLTFKPRPTSEIPAIPPVEDGQRRGFYFILPTASATHAMEHLNAYNLRRKATIEDVSAEFDVWQLLPKKVVQEVSRGNQEAIASKRSVAQLLGLASEQDVSALGPVSFVDPRTSTMGVRVIVPKGKQPTLPSSYSLVPSPSFFHSYRLLLGLSSAPSELLFEKSLPLECVGVDSLGISYVKGCYMGQELTARTKFQGMVRKKIWPSILTRHADSKQQQQLQAKRGRVPMLSELVQDMASTSSSSSSPTTASSSDPLTELQSYFPFFDPSFSTPPPDTPIHRSTADVPVVEGKEVARVTSASHNVCLAMLRNEHVEECSTGTGAALVLDASSSASTEAGETSSDPSSSDICTLTSYRPDWWGRPPEEGSSEGGQ